MARVLCTGFWVIHDRAEKCTNCKDFGLSSTEVGWKRSQADLFAVHREVIARRATLARCCDAKVLCMYRDGGDSYRCSVLTRVPRVHFSLQNADQQFESLAFLFERLNGTEIACRPLEKEVLHVLVFIEYFRDLLASSDTFDLYTAYDRLIFNFDQLETILGTV